MPFGDHCPHGREYATCVRCGEEDRVMADRKSRGLDKVSPKVEAAKLNKARAGGVKDALTYARKIVRETIPEELVPGIRKQLLRKLGERQFYVGVRR